MTASTSPRGAPELSILIRTIGRASLLPALQSVYAQDFEGGVQIVVVVAAGPAPAALPEPPPHMWLQVHAAGLALGRAAAANQALDLARGRALLFLDDDDLLLPPHLTRLSAALSAAPASCPAAYTGVRCISGESEAHVYDAEVHWHDLLLQSGLPIHAVLFRREAVEAAPALRFDTRLEQFEDWDFWLALMARAGEFTRAPGVSAIYRLDAQAGSGHAQSGPQRLAALQRFAQSNLARWSAEDVVALIERNAARTTQHLQLSQLLDAARADVAAARESIEVSQRARVAVERDREDQRLAFERRLSEAAASVEQLLGEIIEWRTQFDIQAKELAAWHERARAKDIELAQWSERFLAQSGELAAHRAALESLGAELSEHRREVAVLAAIRSDHLSTIARLNAHVTALHASTSWRITQPLRTLGRAWTFVRSGRAAMLLRNGAIALRAELERHGLAGSARRLPRHLRHARRHVRMLSVLSPVTQAQVFAPAPPRPPLRGHPELAGREDTLDVSVSVVIPTFNAGDEFEWLLRKLRAQRGLSRVEIVVVDSGSSDATVQRARAHGATLVEITQAEFTHSHSRNVGAQAASGDTILFMVQDAYPIGNLWIRAMVEYLREHAGQGVLAASCAEYPRSDSDLMYECGIATHYRFLGCHENDRIGQFAGADHMALRSMGQLSDVACLIPRQVFMRYRYRGDYAEDLDLGIRLIRDGHKVAMLASVRVIHSHKRSAFYYLKRSFVDVIFLVGLFDDFLAPSCASVVGLLDGACAVNQHLCEQLATWTQQPAPGALGAELRLLMLGLEQRLDAPPAPPGPSGDTQFDAFLAALNQSVEGRRDDAARRESRAFIDSFLARVDHLGAYLDSVYTSVDAGLRVAAALALRQTLAATLGAALAYLYLDRQTAALDDPERVLAQRWYDHLKAGV